MLNDHVASPTYSPFLAARAADLVERNLTGIFHVGGGEPISWFDYAAMIFRVAGLHPELKPTTEREFRAARAPAKIFGAIKRQNGTLGPGAAAAARDRCPAVHARTRAPRATIIPGGSMPARKLLMLVGDYVEDYEVMVPFQALLMVGQRGPRGVPEQARGRFGAHRHS